MLPFWKFFWFFKKIPIIFLLLHSQFLHIYSEQTHSCAELYINSNPNMLQIRFRQVTENKKKQNGFVFLICQYKHTFYLDFWLCACAFSTLTTIFCSSIRKARLILKGKDRLLRTQHPQHGSGAGERPPHLSRTHLAHMEPP